MFLDALLFEEGVFAKKNSMNVVVNVHARYAVGPGLRAGKFLGAAKITCAGVVGQQLTLALEMANVAAGDDLWTSVEMDLKRVKRN